MNAKKLLILFALLSMLLPACSTPARGTYAPAATQAPAGSVGQKPVATVAVEKQKEGNPPYNPPPVAPVLPAPTMAAVGEAPAAGQPPVGGGVPPAAGPLPTSIAAFAPGLPAPTANPQMPGFPPPTPPADNYFQDYGVNPFEDPREDHLSTFALDVDTAAYTVARRYVNDGNLPPADAIRVEEFVNYFNPGYTPPSDVAFAVYADGAPSPFHNDGSQILRIGVQGYQVPDDQRKPSSLTFVIDISGSMDMENRLALVKRSLELLVERLRSNDTIAIVAFGSDARVVLNPTSGQDKGTILNAIYSLQTEGATNAEAGLRLGYQVAYQMLRPGMVNRVILCSDGVANVGQTGPDAILEQIRGYTQQGITLTTIGFGMGNFNDVLMEQLADNGDGNYAYVDTMEEAQKLFVDNLTGTLQVIAKDAKVQVDFNPEVVERYRLIGYENRAVADQDFRNDYVDAGEIGAGHSAVALYAVILHPGSTGRIATVQLRWKDPTTLNVTEINGNFNTWDMSHSFDQADARYQLAVVVAQYAELLRNSPWAYGSSLGQLVPYASRLASLLSSDGDVTEFAALVSRAAQLRY